VKGTPGVVLPLGGSRPGWGQRPADAKSSGPGGCNRTATQLQATDPDQMEDDTTTPRIPYSGVLDGLVDTRRHEIV
jgi:hypothetical protein